MLFIQHQKKNIEWKHFTTEQVAIEILLLLFFFFLLCSLSSLSTHGLILHLLHNLETTNYAFT